MIFNIFKSVTPNRINSVPAVVYSLLAIELLGALAHQVFQILVILDEVSVTEGLFDVSGRPRLY